MAQPLALLNTRAVAERLGVDVSTVARYVRDGKLAAAYDAGGRTGVRLFDPAVVDAFAAARSADPEAVAS